MVFATDNSSLNTFSTGETISSSKMNNNFQYLNSKIDNLTIRIDNLSSSLSILLSDLGEIKSRIKILEITTMQWEDTTTDSCTGLMHEKLLEIATAMPSDEIDLTITAFQINSKTTSIGNNQWVGVFKNDTCVKNWLTHIGEKNENTPANFNPGICQSEDENGNIYNFFLRSGYQAGITNNMSQFVVYFLNRESPWCDLAGVNAENYIGETTNNYQGGESGDYIRFSWVLSE